MIQRRVLVCGCGIAGLTAARALVKDGHTVTMVDRVDQFGTTGAGIVLQANALASLDALGIGERIRALGHRPSNGGIIGADGGKLVHFDAAQMASHPLVADTVSFYRPDLHAGLAHGLEVETHLGVTICRFDSDGQATLSDGTSLDFDILVGADGVHSTIRAQLKVGDALDYSGYTCWRTVVENRIGLSEVLEVWGRGKRVGLVPLSGNRIYAFFVANSPPEGRDDPNLNARELLGPLFSEFRGAAGQFLESLNDDEVMRHDITEHQTIEWGRGNVVLIGDAAHGMTPNMGQGAAQSIEDAIALALVLRGEPGDPAAEMKRMRGRRVHAVKAQSRRIGVVAQWQNPLACAVRNGLAKMAPASLGMVEKMLKPGVHQAETYAMEVR